MDRRRSFSERAYGALLLAFPRPFREEAGLAMAETFRDQCREARARGGSALARLWLRTVVDVARNAPAERIAAGIRKTDGSAPRSWRREAILETGARDLRLALRALRQRPAFALVTVLTLALGLGATTAIFSVVRAVLIAPLPYPDPDRLAFVWGRSPAAPEEGLSWPDFVELRDHNQSFAGLGLVRCQSVNLTGGETPERLTGCFVTADLFSKVLKSRPSLGRTFAAGETEPTSLAPVALVSHGLWQRRFGADPGIVGRDLTLNGAVLKVVGVLPSDFDLVLLGGSWSPDVFLPLPFYPNRDGLTRADRSLFAVGRSARASPWHEPKPTWGSLPRGSRRSSPPRTPVSACGSCPCARSWSATCGRPSSSCKGRWPSSS
jgi:hypothetical protein